MSAPAATLPRRPPRRALNELIITEAAPVGLALGVLVPVILLGGVRARWLRRLPAAGRLCRRLRLTAFTRITSTRPDRMAGYLVDGSLLRNVHRGAGPVGQPSRLTPRLP